MKIRTYLVLMTSAVLIPIIFFSGVAINTLFDTQRDAMLQGARETLTASLLRADTDLSNAVTAVRVLAQSENLASENWASLYGQARAANVGTDMIAVVVDESGHQRVNTYVRFGDLLPQIVEPASLQSALKVNEPQISDLAFGQLSRQFVVLVFQPVTTHSGRRYIVAEVLFASHFKDILPPMGGPDVGVHSVFDRNGKLIATNAAQSNIGKPAKPALRRAMLNDTSGMIRNDAGEDEEDSYTLFARSTLSGWTFSLDLPVSKVEAVPRHAMGLMAIELLFVIGFATIAAVFFGRRLTRSIECAFDSAVALRKGVVPASRNSGIREFEALQGALHEAGLVLKNVETQRAELLEREREARSTAEAQNAAKDQFLAMLGHELRNPLAPISSAAQLLSLKSLDPAKIQRATEIIVRQVKHMTYLVDDLLDVSRVTRGLINLDRDKLDLKRIVADAVEQVQPTMHAMRHHFTLSLPDETVFVLGDHKRLVQVFTNVLANAAKYTPEGGDIRLAMETTHDKVLLTVTDNGIGMTPDLLSRAFDLFAQAERTSERSQGGLGLGLALVKSLVSMHGGAVTAQSAGLGKGSSFTVSLPRLMQAAKSLAPAASVPLCAPRPLRLLVVDDNRDAANMLGEVLKAVSHHPIIEYDPLKALAIAAREAPDVCLLDIGLPTMDGYELARRLRALPATSKAVLIAISGYGQQGDCKRALATGFDYHFVKPVDMEALLAVLEQVARRDDALADT